MSSNDEPDDDGPSAPGETVRAPNGLLVNACVPEALRSNTISLQTSDGVRISALLLGSGNKGAVFVHENGWNVCSWLPFAQVLVPRGYHVMLIESRGTGASGLPPGSTRESGVYRHDIDVLAASEELHRRGATSILVGGASIGGTAATTAAPQIADLAGLVVLSSPRKDYGTDDPGLAMDGIAAAKTITKPSFFAASPLDWMGHYLDEVQALHDASAAKDKRLEVVAGDAGDALACTHGTAMMNCQNGGAVLREKLLTFIDDAFAAD